MISSGPSLLRALLLLLLPVLPSQRLAVAAAAASSSNVRLEAEPATASLRYLSSTTSLEQDTFLVDSSSYDTSYDGYQQAWRYLGFFIDCSNRGRNNNNNNNENNNNADRDRRQRYLNEQDNEATNTCQRYLLWAAVSQ